jgi:hypothetical protein
MDIAPLFIAGLSCTLIGWAMVYLSWWVERLRRERHAERLREHEPALTQPRPWP